MRQPSSPHHPATWQRRGIVRRSATLLLALLAAGSLAACGAFSRSAATLNHTANQQYRAGDFGDALQNYRQAEVLRPDLPALNYNTGNTLVQQNDYQRAITEEQQAARSTDADTQDRAYYSMGNAYVRLNQLQDAIEAYKSALRANPSDVDAKYNLEVIQRRLQQEQARQQQVSPQSQPGQSAGEQAGQSTSGGQTAQQGQPDQAGQSASAGAEQGTQPGNAAAGAPAAGAQQGGPGGANSAASGYTGTPAGQAAALDPSLQQALGQFDKTGSIDSALQALDIIAQQERLQQSGNSQPPDTQGKDW
jgi:Ca-activated chloride channel family protein